MSEKIAYIDKIIEISRTYLKETFPSKERLDEFLRSVSVLREKDDIQDIICLFTQIYIDYVKQDFQNQYTDTNKQLVDFLENKDDGIKIIWGNCLDAMRGMKS